MPTRTHPNKSLMHTIGFMVAAFTLIAVPAAAGPPSVDPASLRLPGDIPVIGAWFPQDQEMKDPEGYKEADIEVRHGCLSLATLALEHEGADKLSLKLGDATLPATIKRTGKRILITLAAPVDIAARQKLMVTVS